jgi:hypothetical protein
VVNFRTRALDLSTCTYRNRIALFLNIDYNFATVSCEENVFSLTVSPVLMHDHHLLLQEKTCGVWQSQTYRSTLVSYD